MPLGLRSALLSVLQETSFAGDEQENPDGPQISEASRQDGTVMRAGPQGKFDEMPPQTNEDMKPGPMEGNGGEGKKGLLAAEYPMTGIISDIDSDTYLVDPSYWSWWKRIDFPGLMTQTAQRSPPAEWWMEREKWRDRWTQLDNGKEGQGIDLTPVWIPPNKDETKPPGSFPGTSCKSCTNIWWKWLEDRQTPDPLNERPKAFLEPKKPRECKNKFFDGDVHEEPVFNELGEVVSEPEPNWVKVLKGEEVTHSTKEYDPGCFCPGPNCVYDDPGFFGGASVEQLMWLNDTSMRRQTLPGLSDMLSFKWNSLRHAAPRLDRVQNGDGKEAATLDPRPPRPVENPRFDWMTEDTVPKLKPYKMESMMGSMGKMIGDNAMDAMMGGSMIEMKAMQRMTTEHPDWLPNLIQAERAKHLYQHGAKKAANELMTEDEKEDEAKDEKIIEERALKKQVPDLLDHAPEPEWTPPPPQPFKDVYQMHYRHFWPAMEILARRGGQGSSDLIDELGKKWRSHYIRDKPQWDIYNGIRESAGLDQRSARIALGGPKGREEEAINAVDQVLPIPQPIMRQAHPSDRGRIPTPSPSPGNKAVLATALPPEKLVDMNNEQILKDGMTVFPSGQNGRGVQAKASPEVMALLEPQILKAPQVGSMGPLGGTAGAVLLTTARNDMELLVRDARLARWRTARTRGRRRSQECTATFL